ncbi:hypothetical protein H5410_046968 [Solanum commersonii]|uniref:Uncharacterized protein n=1 Tax=Solanum commersonii TaxID=4109 RepID=A0A9J5XHB2_SOLCO|nr:hypothetical protein H5410_046968 [Solanum commersonii]
MGSEIYAEFSSINSIKDSILPIPLRPSVSQFSSVSKSQFSSIRSPKFINTHLSDEFCDYYKVVCVVTIYQNGSLSTLEDTFREFHWTTSCGLGEYRGRRRPGASFLLIWLMRNEERWSRVA